MTDLALRYQSAGLKVSSKIGGSPVTDGDLAIDALLKQRLLGARPNYGWLSEESADSDYRLTRRQLFVIDPIDGTTAYLKGTPWYSISLAVVEDGRPIAGGDGLAADGRGPAQFHRPSALSCGVRQL